MKKYFQTFLKIFNIVLKTNYKKKIIKLDAKLDSLHDRMTGSILKFLKKIFQWLKKYFMVIIYPPLVFWSIILYDLDNYSSKFLCDFVFITFTLVSLLLLFPLFNNKNLKIKILIIIFQFISVNFIFASIYFNFFITSPNNYNISNVIRNDKILNEYNDKFAQLLETNRKILLLSEMEFQYNKTLNAILSYKGEYDGPKYKLSKEYSFYFSSHPINASHGTQQNYILHFINNSSNEIIHLGDASFGQFESMSHPLIRELTSIREKDQLIYYIDNIINRLKILQKTQFEDLNKIAFLNADLNFMDFYYFSTITLTTTGYGDITPNSRKVRMVVIIQTIFSVLFIAFALSLFTFKNRNIDIKKSTDRQHMV